MFENSKVKPGQQAQKYHRLLLKGLTSNDKIYVEVISKLPLTRKNNNKLFLKKDSEKVDSINFFYTPIINIPIIKNFISVFILLYYILKASRDRNTVIIGDTLNITTSIVNLVVGKIKGIKTVGIVTDVPSFLASSSKNYNNLITKVLSIITSKINEYIIQKFDSYIFITEEMNKLINKNNKEYVVIEGLVDSEMELITNRLNGKYQKRICMYTGSLKKIYGIKMLTQAFIKSNVEDSELHIYGDGDFKNELIQICQNNESIKYFGVKLNDFIVKEQMRAALLINPRPTNEEYTKYSFPSKNMEYMVSGTPILTTNLPGMPEEYKNYVYLIQDETVEGLSESLKKILSNPRIELHEKGALAKEFVLKQKNNIIQAEKVVKMLKKL